MIVHIVITIETNNKSSVWTNELFIVNEIEDEKIISQLGGGTQRKVS